MRPLTGDLSEVRPVVRDFGRRSMQGDPGEQFALRGKSPFWLPLDAVAAIMVFLGLSIAAYTIV